MNELDRSLRLRRLYNVIVLVEAFALLVAAFFLLAFFEPFPLEALVDERRAQTLFVAWLAKEQAGLFARAGLSALASGLILELARRRIPEDDFAGWG